MAANWQMSVSVSVTSCVTSLCPPEGLHTISWSWWRHCASCRTCNACTWRRSTVGTVVSIWRLACCTGVGGRVECVARFARSVTMPRSLHVAAGAGGRIAVRVTRSALLGSSRRETVSGSTRCCWRSITVAGGHTATLAVSIARIACWWVVDGVSAASSTSCCARAIITRW